MIQWVLAATLICGTTTIVSSCKETKAPEEKNEAAKTVKSEELAVKYEFPAGQKLGWHHHPVMNYGILVQGELTIIGQDGKEKVVHEGEPVVEMVNTIHHGENRGTKPVILYMFYLSQKDSLLAVQHPEIPLE